MKFNIGDKVILNGYIYVSSMAGTPSRMITNKITNITRIAPNTKHPYNTTGDLGWCDENSLTLYEEPKKEYSCEIEVIDTDNLIEYLKTHENKVIIMREEDIKKVFKI